MNLFNEVMKVAKNTAMSSMYQSNSPGGNKEEKLRGQLHQCTYTDEYPLHYLSAKFVIEKAIKQVFHVYPFFETDILSFKENNQQKRFIELKGVIEVEVRGKLCKVDYNMMVPNGFPKKAPYVRIINKNPDFIVDSFYLQVRSPSDPKSYILNEKLQSIRNWDAGSSIVNVIIESYDLMRNKFPFARPNPNLSQGMGGGWGQQPKSSPWSQFNSQPQQSNPQVANFYNGNQGYNNYVNPSSQNQGGFGNNVGFSGTNILGGMFGGHNGQGGPSSAQQPPIPFNAGNVTQTIASGQKFVGANKKTLEKIKLQHTKALESAQALDVLKYSLVSEEDYLRRENIEMNRFLTDNESNQNNESLAKLVRPADELSEQILDLLASVKAREDCTAELEKKFNDGDVVLDEFMKNLRRVEEAKFEEKVLLSKCISVAGNQKPY